MEQDTATRVDIGVRVLGLSMLYQDLRRNFTIELDKLEHGILGDCRARCRIIHQSFESRIGLAKDGMPIARDNATTVECRPEVVVNVLLRVILWDVLLHLDNPAQHFLCGQPADKCQRDIEFGCN